MRKLDRRLDRIESAFDEVQEKRMLIVCARPRTGQGSWTRLSSRHPELSGRGALIELSKDPQARELAREQTELIVAQFVDRSGELQ